MDKMLILHSSSPFPSLLKMPHSTKYCDTKMNLMTFCDILAIKIDAFDENMHHARTAQKKRHGHSKQIKMIIGYPVKILLMGIG